MKRFANMAAMGAAALVCCGIVWLSIVSVAAQPAPPPPAMPRVPGAPVHVTFTSKIGFFGADPALGASYPRVIQIRHYGPEKGDLLATFARRGSLPIWRSTDNGETWQLLSEVAGLRGQPCLYELPAAMGDFPAGTILAAGGGAAAPGAARRTLDVFYSRDGGRSWHFLSTIATGGPGIYDPADRAGLRDQDPVFEPYLYADAEGRLVAYFSDERHKKDGYSQLLDHEVSSDGGRSWSAPVYDVAIADGLSRPGMAVVTRDGHGRYYMSYEIVGMPGHALEPRSNLTHIRMSDDGDHWGDPADYGTLVQDRWRQYPNATPYIVWSPWGGPDGTLVVSARGIMRDNLGLVGGGMMINRDGGRGLWTLIETPIVYDPAQDGYSQTMIPLGNGREILQLAAVSGRIEYAKFELPEKLPSYGFPWDGPRPGNAVRAEDRTSLP